MVVNYIMIFLGLKVFFYPWTKMLHFWFSAGYVLLWLGLFIAFPCLPHAQPDMIRKHAAVLRVLNKITTETFSLHVPNHHPLDIKDTLRIRVRICYQHLPTQRPESIAFIEISEITLEQNIIPSFSGWIFASSPSLSGLEHPIYDIWLLTCSDDHNDL